MLRSMYAGISGMKAFQTKLDVVGNNIANVNTFGFKKGRVTFQDLMSQTIQGAQAPQVDAGGNPVIGGKNPMQVGLGVNSASIDTIHTGGNTQTTNRTLDFALEGDGMFVLAKNNTADSTINVQDDDLNFTRAGNFYLDSEGHIVNANGYYLVGIPEGGTGNGLLQIPEDAQSFSIASDGSVNYVDAGGNPQVAGQIQIAKFSNPEGLQKAGSNLYKLTDNAGAYDTNNDGVMELLSPGDAGSATIRAGALEMSNVDLSEEFTEMITAQRGFQANTRIITTSDEILQELVNLKR
ncbi:flagellar basal body rod protein FlgG [Salinibacillus xinjiangensis]|uniref:Flagellar hook protein FlgE n=1 Tax=Salinibacillus xinjiangensis TaxID=1229268 RepID=A0A6G1X363_9BACI|nr:flagellar basal body rod protein FlgG [Salinibacillus xinjiangensis]MRG85394.1 flagellar basal body rod protein FlgG [Salinibacillus xinjiangensis]